MATNASERTGPLRFDGQVAIITGAGGGMGATHAQVLARRGAKVVMNDVNEKGLSTVADKIKGFGGEVATVAGSIAEKSTAEQLVSTALARFGRVDILVNNAGIASKLPFDQVTDELFHRMLSVHVVGSWMLTQAVWPHMKKQKYGRIINVSSTSIYGIPENSAYVAAKGALLGMGKALAIEGNEFGINVNILGPTATTDMTKSTLIIPSYDELDAKFPPWATSVVVAWLAHKDCDLQGQIITAYGTRYGKMFLGETRGKAGKTEEYDVEFIRDHMAEARDETQYFVPGSIREQAHALDFFQDYSSFEATILRGSVAGGNTPL